MLWCSSTCPRQRDQDLDGMSSHCSDNSCLAARLVLASNTPGVNHVALSSYFVGVHVALSKLLLDRSGEERLVPKECETAMTGAFVCAVVKNRGYLQDRGYFVDHSAGQLQNVSL